MSVVVFDFAADVVVMIIVPPLPFVWAILVVDDISVFCIKISGTVCMLFVRRFVAVAADIADVVMTIAPLLPFLCKILVIDYVLVFWL